MPAQEAAIQDLRISNQETIYVGWAKLCPPFDKAQGIALCVVSVRKSYTYEMLPLSSVDSY